MCTQTVMKPQWSSQEGVNANILFQEHSLDCLFWPMKGQDKADDD